MPAFKLSHRKNDSVHRAIIRSSSVGMMQRPTLLSGRETSSFFAALAAGSSTTLRKHVACFKLVRVAAADDHSNQRRSRFNRPERPGIQRTSNRIVTGE